MVDISDRRAVESQREAILAELERRNTALDSFAAIASHDLRAPLRGIASLADWIEEELGESAPESVRSHLSKLKMRAHRLQDLIAGILDYSLAAREEPQKDDVDVVGMLNATVELLAPPQGASVEVDAPGDLPRLSAERVPLQQVFLNLLSNALKHSARTDAQIRIGVRVEGDGAFHFTVKDNGPGIAPEFHERIWASSNVSGRAQATATALGCQW